MHLISAPTLAIIVFQIQIAPTASMQAGTRIAVAQLTSKAVKWDNLIQVARCAGWARQASCRMLFLPECFGFLGSTAAETLAAAEDPSFARSNGADFNQLLTGLVTAAVDDEDAADSKKVDAISPALLSNQQVSIVDGLRTIAKAAGMWISAGGVHVTTEAGDKVYNTHLILDESGEIRARYSKIHLFDVCIPAENVDLRESRATEPGSTLVVCPDTPLGMLPICRYTLYNLISFRELMRSRSSQAVLVYPSAMIYAFRKCTCPWSKWVLPQFLYRRPSPFQPARPIGTLC
jgi:deaminated glutathione amidase